MEEHAGVGQVPPKLKDLGTALAAIASPTRLLLLQRIRTPSTLQEIELPPGAEGEHARNVSRQTVRHHLDRLIDAGMVTMREAERAHGVTVEYVVNHQALFALAEELRTLARLRPVAEPVAPTMRSAAEPVPTDAPGPHLLLVKGLDEGRAFPLPPPVRGRREWVVGRKRGVDVALDFDPFVSSENALVVWDQGAYYVQDLPGSANGTTHDFRPLAAGERRTLRTGDLIGVGRSLLMYRAR